MQKYLRSDVKPEMNFLTLSTRVHDKETAIRFLQSHGVIHQQRLCNNGHQMTLSTVSDRWRCNARQCRQEIGLRKGTWLERSRMEWRGLSGKDHNKKPQALTCKNGQLRKFHFEIKDNLCWSPVLGNIIPGFNFTSHVWSGEESWNTSL